MEKIITFRANEEDLNMLSDLIDWTNKTWKDAGIYKKPTMTDIIFQAILNDWQKKCLPFKQNN